MPPSKRPYRNYTAVQMEQAVEEVKHGKSVASVSKLFGIPRITLLYKVKGKYSINCNIGPSTVLTPVEEEHLVKWLLTVSDAGFPATKLQLLDSVQIIMKKLKRPNPFIDGRPGRKWFSSFLKRHPQISERLTQNLTKPRSELTENKLRNWFNEVESYVNSKTLKDLFLDSRRVFNADETAFFLSPKGVKCLVRKGDKTPYNFISNDDKECLTCLMGSNAAGMLLPPMIIFCYERIPQHISNLMPKGWAIGKSDSGWMTGQTFFEYISNIFHPWLVANNIPLPVVLFVDGHSSHLTMELSSFCVENGIELIALYPNSTHILQPMDVAAFHPLKEAWKKAVQKYKIQNNGEKLKREYFAPLLKTVIEESLAPITIQNGFKTCGLCPLDANAISYGKYFKTGVPKDISTKHRLGYTQRDLHFLESEIGNSKLQKFIEGRNSDIWQGDVEDTSLFQLWKKIYDDVSGGVSRDVCENVSQDVQLEQIVNTSSNSPMVGLQVTPPKQIIIHSNISVNLAANGELNKNNAQVSDPSIPSPFKSSLFWPKPGPAKNKRSKEKIPSVATSDQWRDYHSKKQNEKEKREKEKEERKRKREEKKQEKEECKKRKLIKSQKYIEESSDSSIDMELESEGEGDDWDKISENSFEITNDSLRVNKYVVVKYDENYYPGRIVEVKDQQYQISAMVSSGKDWKWPIAEDIMWYQKSDVIRVINTPISKNKRGVVAVPEMNEYSNVYYN